MPNVNRTNVNRTNKRKNKRKNKRTTRTNGQDGGAFVPVVGAIAAGTAAYKVGEKMAFPARLGHHDFNKQGCSEIGTFECNYSTWLAWNPITLTVNCGSGDIPTTWTAYNKALKVIGEIQSNDGFTLDIKVARESASFQGMMKNMVGYITNKYELSVRFNYSEHPNASRNVLLTNSGQKDSGAKLILGWKDEQVESFVDFLNFFPENNPDLLEGWYKEAETRVTELEDEVSPGSGKAPNAWYTERGRLNRVKDKIVKGRQTLEALTVTDSTIMSAYVSERQGAKQQSEPEPEPDPADTERAAMNQRRHDALMAAQYRRGVAKAELGQVIGTQMSKVGDDDRDDDSDDEEGGGRGSSFSSALSHGDRGNLGDFDEDSGAVSRRRNKIIFKNYRAFAFFGEEIGKKLRNAGIQSKRDFDVLKFYVDEQIDETTRQGRVGPLDALPGLSASMRGHLHISGNAPDDGGGPCTSEEVCNRRGKCKDGRCVCYNYFIGKNCEYTNEEYPTNLLSLLTEDEEKSLLKVLNSEPWTNIVLHSDPYDVPQKKGGGKRRKTKKRKTKKRKTKKR
jgi:hypothetical protein